MFYEKSKRRAGVRRINLRIAFMFSGLFALTALLLLGGIYYTLKTSLDREDYRFIQHKLLEHWAGSQAQGIEDFIHSLDGSAMRLEGTPYFLRVADRENLTIFFMYPQGWRGFFPENDFEELSEFGEGSFLFLTSPQHSYTLMYATIRLEDDYILQIGVSTERTQKIVRLIVRNFSILLIPLLLVSVIGGAVLTARLLTPIQKLAEAAGNIAGTGNLKARIREGRAHDELSDLVSLFNRMLEHIEALVNGMQGTLDTVAHDLRTPLTRFRGTAELALTQEDPARLREALEDGLEEAEMIITQLNAIMDLSEAQTGILKLNTADTDITQLCRQLVEMYSYVADEKNIRITLKENGAALHAPADAPRLCRVVGNLLDNAVKYSPNGTQLSVELSKHGGRVILRVCDQGPGIPGEELPRIWERLYRGELARQKPGLGIGLSLAKAIIEAHGGGISAQSPPEGGAVFELWLPADTRR